MNSCDTCTMLTRVRARVCMRLCARVRVCVSVGGVGGGGTQELQLRNEKLNAYLKLVSLLEKQVAALSGIFLFFGKKNDLAFGFVSLLACVLVNRY